MAKITGSHLVVKALQAEGVDTVFGIAGDHFLHLLDVMVDYPFRMIDTRHEQGAVHMADAYARTLRRPGVAMSTTPGHANAIPGLANAQHSQAPVVNIAGSAATDNLGRGAMQEFDQVGVASPVTKGAWQVPSAERIPEYISLAFRLAMAGERGPVHLTIPQDLQEVEVDEDVFDRFAPSEYGKVTATLADPARVDAAIDMLRGAEKPMIIAGTGAGATVAPEELQRFVEATGIPTLTMESARGLLPDSHELCAGFGYQPLNDAAKKVRDADVVLLLGQKLDYTWGFGGTPPFRQGVKHIMVYPSAAEIGRSRTVSMGILGDVGPVVTQLADRASQTYWPDWSAWNAEVQKERTEFQERMQDLAVESDPPHPLYVAETLRRHSGEDTPMVFDGGDYCHFFRTIHRCEKPSRWLYVSTFGMIGVGVAYALGMQAALPDKRVVLVTGDGSFGFNGMEMDTAVRHNLPVVTLVGNNSYWGIDWQIQKGLYGRPVWTDLSPTRWDIVAQGLGAYGENVDRAENVDGALKRAFAQDKPAVLNIAVDRVISPVAEAAVNRKLGTH